MHADTPPATPTPEGLAAAWGLLTTPDGCRLAAMEVYDLARAAVDEAAGGAFSDYQGGDTVPAAVARLCALAAGAKAGEGAGG